MIAYRPPDFLQYANVFVHYNTAIGSPALMNSWAIAGRKFRTCNGVVPARLA
jgi:hypothetical protein